MHPQSFPESAIDWDELFDYLPGTLVEQVDEPGIFYEIEGYEATMVPPIWLVNEPRPRYPHELRIVSRQSTRVCALEPILPSPRTMHPV